MVGMALNELYLNCNLSQIGSAAVAAIRIVPRAKSIAAACESLLLLVEERTKRPARPTIRANSMTQSCASKSILNSGELIPLPPSMASNVSTVADVPETAAARTS